MSSRRYIISGNLSARQNLNSIMPWLRDYYPVLKEAEPDARLILAGRNPGAELLSLCAHLGVEVIASPDNMDEILDSADIYLCPSDNGSGIKLRMMDGLSHGLPVIAHKLAVRGYESFVGNGIYPYEDIEGFRNAIAEVGKGQIDREAMKAAYKRQFSFRAGVSRLSGILAKLSLLLLLPLSLHAAPVRIGSQEEFLALGKVILDQIDQGEKTITVSFERGTYFFPDNLITMVGLDAGDVSISIDGNESSFLGEGRLLRNGDLAGDYSFNNGWTDLENGQSINMQGPVGLCRFYPLPTNFARTSFRIPTREKDLSPNQAKDVYVIITQWYKGVIFKVDKIRRGWIYYHEIEPSPTKWYTELRFGRCLPRYQLLNRPEGEISLVDGKLSSGKELYRSDASCFFYVRDSKIASISIKNCHFEANDAHSPLMFFHGLQTDSLSVTDCRFRGIRGDGICLWGTDNVRFCRNEAIGNYRSVVKSDCFSDNTIVSGNVFRDNGLAFSNDPVVLCQGGDLLIENNYFEDFTYSAVSVGLHYSYEYGEKCSGYVRKNEICHTPGFRKKPMRSIIDGGAIYVYTQNKNIVISGNYVHDIGGHHGNRGIFCDDGVNNVTIEGNRVLRIENSYPIDLRHFEKVSRMKDSHVARGNMHNRIYGNTVDAKCRLYVRKDDAKSCIRDNLYL